MAKKGKKEIIPLGDRVLIRCDEEGGETTTTSGIIIPETARDDKPQTGRVVAVGEGRVVDSGEVISPSVSVGDVVVFSKFGGDEVQFDGEEYLIVGEANILAVIK